MSKWRGFREESKAYMNHPDYWKEWDHISVFSGGWTMADRQRAKWRFWVGYPRAWLRFHFFTVRDWLREARAIRI